jgi:transposase-like protein
METKENGYTTARQSYTGDRRGSGIGRPPKLKPQQRQEIVKLVKRGKKTAADAARLFGVHPATVSRLLQRTESLTVLSVPWALTVGAMPFADA